MSLNKQTDNLRERAFLISIHVIVVNIKTLHFFLEQNNCPTEDRPFDIAITSAICTSGKCAQG